jgi:CTP-dependent riboflavin kinase
MIELLLTLVGILLAVTVGAAIEYYRQIRNAQREFEKAKDAVEDIVLSFNKELKREADKLEIMAYKAEASAFKADASLKRADIIEKKIAPIEGQVNAVTENNAAISARLTDVDAKIRDITTSQETLKTKVAAMDEQTQKFLTLPIPEAGSEPVIPIKRDKAIAALTETELTVLEMLSAEGPKTAPEIKERVQLSREHTARLMKKLYEEGYLERETGKIPFKYNVKEEMKKLLKKTEPPQT